MLFFLTMKVEANYSCISNQQDTGIIAYDLSSFNDRRIGVNKGTLQKDLLLAWMEENSIHAQVVELAVSQAEVIAMFHGGDIDVFVDIDVYGIVPDFSPVCKIGASDFYFAVTRTRIDLLDKLKVDNGEADCVLVCNYQLGKLDDTLRKHGLTPITTGSNMNFTFAIRSGDDYLYSIMNKSVHFVPESAVNSALIFHSYDEKEFSVVDFLKEQMVSLLSASGAVLTLILLLLNKSLRSERKAKKSLLALKESLGREEKQKKEIDVTKARHTQTLSPVSRKNAYSEASNEIQRSIANGEKTEFAIIVFDVNDLKKVNDFYGHDAGDRHILSAKKLICDVFKHSPVYRIGGDEFTVILTGTDYENAIELLLAFDRQVKRSNQVKTPSLLNEVVSIFKLTVMLRPKS